MNDGIDYKLSIIVQYDKNNMIGCWLVLHTAAASLCLINSRVIKVTELN